MVDEADISSEQLLAEWQAADEVRVSAEQLLAEWQPGGEARITAAQLLVEWHVDQPEAQISSEQALVEWAAGEEARVSSLVALVEWRHVGHDFSMQADGGVFAIEGEDATLRHGVSMGADGGSFDVAGGEARSAITGAASPGAYLITGTTSPEHFVMPADGGQFSLSGLPANMFDSVASNRYLSPLRATLDFDGLTSVELDGDGVTTAELTADGNTSAEVTPG